ncbi:hypothetical protein [Phocaeicola sp.]
MKFFQQLKEAMEYYCMSEDKFTDEERRVLKSACKETLKCIHRQEDARLKKR